MESGELWESGEVWESGEFGVTTGCGSGEFGRRCAGARGIVDDGREVKIGRLMRLLVESQVS